MKQHNFSLVLDAQLGGRQCLDDVTAVAMGASVTFSTFFVFGRDRTCSQAAVLRRHIKYIPGLRRLSVSPHRGVCNKSSGCNCVRRYSAQVYPADATKAVKRRLHEKSESFTVQKNNKLYHKGHKGKQLARGTER